MSSVVRIIALALTVVGTLLAIVFVLDLASVWALELGGVLVLLGIVAPMLARRASIEV